MNPLRSLQFKLLEPLPEVAFFLLLWAQPDRELQALAHGLDRSAVLLLDHVELPAPDQRVLQFLVQNHC